MKMYLYVLILVFSFSCRKEKEEVNLITLQKEWYLYSYSRYFYNDSLGKLSIIIKDSSIIVNSQYITGNFKYLFNDSVIYGEDLCEWNNVIIYDIDTNIIKDDKITKLKWLSLLSDRFLLTKNISITDKGSFQSLAFSSTFDGYSIFFVDDSSLVKKGQ